MSKIQLCPVCGGGAVQLGDDLVSCLGDCGIDLPLAAWNRLSDAAALLRAVEVLGAQDYVFALAFPGWQRIDIRPDNRPSDRTPWTLAQLLIHLGREVGT